MDKKVNCMVTEIVTKISGVITAVYTDLYTSNYMLYALNLYNKNNKCGRTSSTGDSLIHEMES